MKCPDAFSSRRFAVEGLNIERLLVRAADSGVRLRSVRRTAPRRVEGTAAERDIIRLQRMADDGGWQFRPGERTGMACVPDLVRRHSRLLVCLGCACLFIALCSAWIWRVEVVGGGRYKPDVLSYLSDIGVKPPVRRSAIDTDEIEARLQWRYPDVTWIECALRGSTLEISLHEGTPEGNSISLTGSSDVAASRGGVIVQVVTTAGTAAVSPGQTVRAGEVLIRGEERQKDGTVTPVRAGGCIMARVWDAASASSPLCMTETTYTGESSETLTAATPWFCLWEAEAAPFALCDDHVTVMPLGGLFIPLWTIRTTSHAYTQSTVPVDASQARESAGDAACAALLRKTGFDDDFVDKWVEYSMIEDEIVCAYAYGERIIDIAADAPP